MPALVEFPLEPRMVGFRADDEDGGPSVQTQHATVIPGRRRLETPQAIPPVVRLGLVMTEVLDDRGFTTGTCCGKRRCRSRGALHGPWTAFSCPGKTRRASRREHPVTGGKHGHGRAGQARQNGKPQGWTLPAVSSLRVPHRWTVLPGRPGREMCLYRAKGRRRSTVLRLRHVCVKVRREGLCRHDIRSVSTAAHGTLALQIPVFVGNPRKLA